MTKYDWSGSGFTAHGKKGDARRATLSRPTATAPKKRSLSPDREARLVRRVARLRRETESLKTENKKLQQEVATLQHHTSKTNPANLAAASDQVLREQQRVAQCKAAYAALAQKYNHLLAHHVRKTQPKIDAYGSNMSRAELDEQVNEDIGHASATGLAEQLGLFDSSCPTDPLALFAHA